MVCHIKYVNGKLKKSFYRVSKKKRLKKKELKICKSMNGMQSQTNEDCKQKCAEHYKKTLIK